MFGRDVTPYDKQNKRLLLLFFDSDLSLPVHKYDLK